MQQKYKVYFCKYLHRNIGEGMLCLTCDHMTKRPNREGKVCIYEQEVGEYTREV